MRIRKPAGTKGDQGRPEKSMHSWPRSPADPVRRQFLQAIPLLTTILALSPAPLFAATPAKNMSLSIPERESAHAAGLSPAAIADVVARHILDKKPYPAGLIWSVPLEALLALYDATGNEAYLDFARDAIRGYDEAYKLGPVHDVGFSLYLRTGDPQDLGDYVVASRKNRDTVVRAFDGAVSLLLDHYSAGHGGKPDATNGGDPESMRITRDGIALTKEMTPLWLDHMAAYTTQMARAGWLSGDPGFYKECLDQYLIFRTALRDPVTGLWGHGRGWYGTARDVQTGKFCRAQAWLLRSFVDTLPFLPPDSPEFRQVHAMMLDLGEALLRYQDKDGFWHQLADHPESFQETSATALTSYFFARGVRLGYLPRERFEAASRKAFAALSKHRISADGIVYGGAMATPPFNTVEQYLSRPTPAQDPHAVGAVMMAAAGQLMLDGKRDFLNLSQLPR